MSRGRGRKRKRKETIVEERMLNPRTLNDPTVLAILEKIRMAPTEEEAARYLLALDNRVAGDVSLANTDPDAARKQVQVAAERDQAAQAWEKDRKAFIEDVFNQSEKNKLTGTKAEQVRARAVQQLQEARRNARAAQITRQLKLEDELEHGPKEEVSIAGNVRLEKMGDGRIVPRVYPEVVNVMHKQFVYPPGTHTVPKVVADILRHRRQTQAETAEREEHLRGWEEVGELEAAQMKIDRKYSTGRDRLDGSNM